MSLYRRGKVWWYEFLVRGRRYRGSTGARSIVAAREIAAERQRLARAGIAADPLVSDALELWVGTAAVSAKTRQNYEGFAAPVKAALGRLRLSAVEPEHVLAYRQRRLAAGAAAATINQEVNMLGRVLKRAGRWERIRAHVRGLPARRPGRAASEGELERLLAAADPRARTLRSAMLVAADTGLRKGELLALTWDDVDLGERLLTVRRAKTQAGAGRSIPLTRRALDALLELGPPRPGARVFARGFEAAWRTARRRAGVKMRWHDWRHTATTFLLETGEAERTVQAITGHADPAMLDRYSHARLEAKRRAVEKMEGQRDIRGHKMTLVSPQKPPQGKSAGLDRPAKPLTAKE